MMSDRQAALIRACEIVNQDPAIREIEEEFGALQDEIEEPWEDTLRSWPCPTNTSSKPLTAPWP